MEQKNLLLAIVLSVGILIGFQFLFEKLRPTPVPTPSTSQVSPPSQTAATPGATGGTTSSTVVPEGTPAARAMTPETREQAIADHRRVRINTARLHGSIALIGGRIDDLTLANYHETVDPRSPEVVLLWPRGTHEPYFADFGWVPAGPGEKAKLPDADTRWQAPADPLTPTRPVTLTWDNGEGLVFTRTISVDENYMFSVRDTVRNHGNASVALKPYARIKRTGTPVSSGYYILHEGLAGFLGGHVFGGGSGFLWLGENATYTSLTPGDARCFAKPPGDPKLRDCPASGDTLTGGWLGFTDKYWLTALVPPQDAAITARFIRSVDGTIDRYQADFTGPVATVAADSTTATSARFFAGAKEVNLLDAYQDAGIPKFDLAIDWGLYYFLTKPIFFALQFFATMLGNFGLAILLFTLLVKLAFFPLANKSYQAMSKMKLLQPEMVKIREKFPDDKQRQQQEIMAMYKKVGANPMAGCLPIVIQIPVFFSLYKVLFVTIEMRHAPFFGWIHDLSAPDPTTFINLFGLLPFTPPAFLMPHLAVGLWPLIMGVTMFLQQKLNPQPVDPVQARMFMFLPIVFTYMLSSFPAGLVIYWAWNNTLSIAQQWLIMHRAGAA